MSKRDVLLPQLSMGMSEGTVVEWRVADGDYIEKDAVLVAIETEKVVTELPSPYAGHVQILVPIGETVAVETPIAIISQQASANASSTAQAAATAAAAPTDETSAAHEKEAAETSRIVASGRARKIASEQGIALASVCGTGPNGRIVARDLPAAEAAATAEARPVLRERARIPLKGLRRAIADRMLRAKTTAAPVYMFLEIDVTGLVASRQTRAERSEESDGRISMTAFYVKALATALREVPVCNATLTDNEVVLWETINVAVAVAIAGESEYGSGLVAPVVRDVADKGLRTLDAEIKNIVSRARSGALTLDDMSGGTVSLSSSTGWFAGAWMVATPLLNLPMVVSFSPGTPLQKPVVLDGEVRIRTMLPCALTFDHRALDGKPATDLARGIAEALSNPESMRL
jgi:pyruvate/2-oxoglutarate dehydrogenase complex dihydrolipoamide acyltransferase (E2) component